MPRTKLKEWYEKDWDNLDKKELAYWEEKDRTATWWEHLESHITALLVGSSSSICQLCAYRNWRRLK